MGTRHLIGVYFNGEYKIAQYGQWDGYPEGQGIDVLKFLQNKELVAKLRNNLEKCRFIRDKEEENRLNALLEKNEPETLDWFYNFASRDLGAEILTKVALCTKDEIVLLNRITFANDSLFCEWAYIIDFDKGTFEIFKGFNEEKLSPDERFYNKEFVSNNGYEPVKFVKSFPLDALPDEEEFLSSFAEPEDDEDEVIAEAN